MSTVSIELVVKTSVSRIQEMIVEALELGTRLGAGIRIANIQSQEELAQELLRGISDPTIAVFYANDPSLGDKANPLKYLVGVAEFRRGAMKLASIGPDELAAVARAFSPRATSYDYWLILQFAIWGRAAYA